MGCSSSNDVSYTQIDTNIWRGKLKIWLHKATIRKDMQLFGKQVCSCGRQPASHLCPHQSKLNNANHLFPFASTQRKSRSTHLPPETPSKLFAGTLIPSAASIFN